VTCDSSSRKIIYYWKQSKLEYFLSHIIIETYIDYTFFDENDYLHFRLTIIMIRERDTIHNISYLLVYQHDNQTFMLRIMIIEF